MKKFVCCGMIYAGIVVLVLASKAVSGGVRAGIDTCLTLVIPSLFIFMVVANLVQNSSAKEIMVLPFSPLARLLRLNNAQMSVVILSLIGGYPVGAKLIANAVKSGSMSVKTGERMLCYCVNCGPAFLVSGVGVAVFGDAKIGLILYASQVVACFLICMLLRPKKIELMSEKRLRASGAKLVVDAVVEAVKSMGVVCGFVVVFAAIMPLIQSAVGENFLFINGILEVTTACNTLKFSQGSIALACLFTAFGGICVHMQVAAMLHGANVTLKLFYPFRLLYTGVSVLITWVTVMLNPAISACFSVSSTPLTVNSVSPTVTLFLVMLAIVLISTMIGTAASGKSAKQ